MAYFAKQQRSSIAKVVTVIMVQSTEQKTIAPETDAFILDFDIDQL